MAPTIIDGTNRQVIDGTNIIDGTNRQVIDGTNIIDGTNHKIIDGTNRKVIDGTNHKVIDGTNHKVIDGTNIIDGTNRQVIDGTNIIDGTNRQVIDGTNIIDGTNRQVIDGTNIIDGTNSQVIDGTNRKVIDGTNRKVIDGTNRNYMEPEFFGTMLARGQVDNITDGEFTVLGRKFSFSSTSELRRGDYVSVRGGETVTGGFVATLVTVASQTYVAGSSTVTIQGVITDVDAESGTARIGGIAVDFTAAMANLDGMRQIGVGDWITFNGTQPLEQGGIFASDLSH